MKALENITINQKYGLVLKEDIDKQNELIDRLQEQISEANSVICGLYHLVTDKKAASGVVCDYLVKYGKPFELNKWGVK